MNKLISVIIPIYNSEKYMDKCIKSIINQTYNNLEIILVNDGSKDNSLKKCKEYEKIDKRIHVINKENGGASSARNKGLDVCKGDYISFIDSDDWLDSDAYELFSKYFEKNYDIIFFNSTNEYENGKSIRNHGMNSVLEMNSEKALINLNSYMGITLGPSDKLFKRELFSNIRFPEGVICEDYYIMPKLFRNSKKLLYLPLWKYHYSVRENSVSHSSKIYLEYIDASNEQRLFINKYYPNISYVGNCAYVFANIMVYNSCIMNNITIDNKLLKQIHDDVIIYRKDIRKNKYLPFKKKVQAYLYFYSLPLYNKIILKIKKK